MKLGPVTKFDKKNKTTSKNSDDNVISGNGHCHFSDFRPIWSSPEAGFQTQSLEKLFFQ